ncbi:MAG: amino acid permease [Clostridiaceae bacterium]
MEDNREEMVCEVNHGMKRGLKNRHIQMIALGTAIGTGLFLVSASTIQAAGPAVLIAYALAGMVIFFIMRSIGEMAVENPIAGSFSAYAEQYWGKFPGFVIGWNWWYLCVVVGMLELSAAGVFMDFFFPTLPHWITALVFLIIIFAANMINVEAFGEFEFWFSIIKVTAVVSMIIFGVFLIFGIGTGKPTGFSNLWAYGGFFPKGIKGLLLSLVAVTFTFGGIEAIATTAGEVQNPEKTLPKAINSVLLRIFIFYLGAIGVMLIIWPWTKVGLDGSPFVLMMSGLGIPAAALILNIVCLTACLSVFNCMVYSNSRILYGLAKTGDAPKLFGVTNKRGVPVKGLMVMAVITLLAVVLNYAFDKVIIYLVAVIIGSEFITWGGIVITQLHFRKKIGEHAKDLKYKSLLFPYANYFVLAYFALLLILMIIMPDYRMGAIALPIWIGILFVAYKIKNKVKGESVIITEDKLAE